MIHIDIYQIIKPYYFIESLKIRLFSNYQTTKFSSLIIFSSSKYKNALKNVRYANRQFLRFYRLIGNKLFFSF